MQVMIATQKDDFRKPERGMWDFFVEHGNQGVAPGATSFKSETLSLLACSVTWLEPRSRRHVCSFHDHNCLPGRREP